MIHGKTQRIRSHEGPTPGHGRVLGIGIRGHLYGRPRGPAGYRTIEPLRGYWIHVTNVVGGAKLLPVTGPAVAFDRIEDAGWHAIGPLLKNPPISGNPDPASPIQNVNAVFDDLDPAITDRILDVWGFDPVSMQFLNVTDFVKNSHF